MLGARRHRNQIHGGALRRFMYIHPFIPLYAPEDKWVAVRSSYVGVFRRHQGLESNTRTRVGGAGGRGWWMSQFSIGGRNDDCPSGTHFPLNGKCERQKSKSGLNTNQFPPASGIINGERLLFLWGLRRCFPPPPHPVSFNLQTLRTLPRPCRC